MPNFNKVIIAGHLTRDPELVSTATGMSVCKGGIAVTDKYTAKDGTKHENTCFVDYVMFGKSAETFKQYMAKGRAVLLEGKLNLEQWDDKETGKKRSKHTIKVDNFTFLGSPGAKKPETDADGAVIPDGPSGEEIPF